MPSTNSTISLAHYRLAAEVAEYIREHACERELLSIPRLAQRFGVCRTTLKTCFKYRHGVSVHKYVLSARVEKAKNLILERPMPIKEIAWELGYTDVANFARDFRKVVGISAGEWVRGNRVGRMEMEEVGCGLQIS